MVLREHLDIEHRPMLSTCYATAPRIGESFSWGPVDIDSERMVVRVVQSNGRYVLIPTMIRQIVTLLHRIVPCQIGWESGLVRDG